MVWLTCDDQNPFHYYGVALTMCIYLEELICDVPLIQVWQLRYIYDPAYAPLYRYYGNGEHFYTTNINEIGGGKSGQTGANGYKLEGIAAIFHARAVPGVVLYPDPLVCAAPEAAQVGLGKALYLGQFPCTVTTGQHLPVTISTQQTLIKLG